MANTTIRQFVSISHLLLILISLKLSTAATPNGGTNITTTNHHLELSGLEFDGRLSEFSTWESASTHRILAGSSTNRINIEKIPTNKNLPACKAGVYRACIIGGNGKMVRQCSRYDRCHPN